MAATTSEFVEIVNPYLLKVYNQNKQQNGESKVKLADVPLEFLDANIIELCAQNSFQYHSIVILFLKYHFEIDFLLENLYNAASTENKLIKEDSSPLHWIDLWSSKEEIEKYKNTFTANLEVTATALYSLLLSLDKSVKEKFTNNDQFQIYILSLTLNDLFSYSLNEKENIFLKERWELNFSLLKAQSVDIQKQWWHLAASFYAFHKELGDSYLHLDSLKIRSALTEAKWLKQFSYDELMLKELLYKNKLLEVQITLKQQDPTLSEADCLRDAQLELLKEQEEMKKMLQNISFARNLDLDLMITFLPMNSPEIKEYRNEADKYFRLAVKLLHPDRRIYLLNGKKLSQEQENELNTLYKEVISIREKKEFDISELISGDYFSVTRLKRIVSQAQTILSAYGIEVSTIKLMVLGDDINSQLKFLLNEYNLLNIELAQIQAEIHVLYSDQETYQKDHIMRDPEMIEITEKKFANNIEKFKVTQSRLEEELKKLFFTE
ncbi:MAG: hypothetical protein NTX65_12675 [Ignavibacteriales bacterium]|nr:hypothetical protein [Ignavibacteriales bacterium]